jgi:signal transduction histidine kinase
MYYRTGRCLRCDRECADRKSLLDAVKSEYMELLTLTNLISIIGCALYLVLAVIAVRRCNLREGVSRWLMLFLGISFLWSLFQVFSGIELTPVSFNIPVRALGITLTTIAFYSLTYAILQAHSKPAVWYPVGLAWLVIVMLLSSHLIPSPTIQANGRSFQITTQSLSLTFLILGWAVFITVIVSLLVKTRQGTASPIIKNKAYYWSLGTILIIASDIFFFTNVIPAGNAMRWVAVVLIASVIFMPYMPAIRQVERQILGYLLMTILTAIVLLAGLFISPSIFEHIQQSYNSTLAGVVIALLIAALLSPLWVFSQKIINHLFPTAGYNPNHILREYSQSISNILDPELLATVAVGLISEAIEIQSGYLFLVDLEVEEGMSRYRLRGSKGMGADQPNPGFLASNSPIANRFRQERKPLRQSDIDLQPEFQRASAEERTFLSKLGGDVYMPIYTKEEWVGLIALGPKLSGLPYFDDDLSLLGILADQTAVALQNARLVESLMRLNNDFRRAYAAMEQANRHLKLVNTQLENLDRTKSDFISVASHELRTPLTVMRGYNEMLLEDPGIRGNPFYGKLVKGIYSGIMRLHEIVNSMLDMASIDTRSLDLKVEPVSLHMIIHMLVTSFAETLKERDQTIEEENLRDLPQVDADAEAIRKVFYHLIINAIKYTPDGGKITITGVAVSPGQMELKEGGVEIIVSDTGIGINPGYLDLIFTKFYQTGELALHSTGKTKFKGAGPGLGLAIARGIVDAHRGKIWAESPGYDEEKCPGSQFHVVLPLHYQE